MKKRILSFMVAMVLFVGTLSTSAFAVTPTPTLSEVNAEVIKTANYIATELRNDSSSNKLTITKYSYVIYLQRSGIECTDIVNKYLNLVAQNINSEGKLLISGQESSGFYGAVLLIMRLAYVDATNFNGVNLVEKFESCINAEDYSAPYTYNTSTYSYPYNPTYLAYAVFATKAYTTKMSNPTAVLDKLKTALLNSIRLGSSYETNVAQSNYKGVDFYGINPDNNAKVLSALKYFYATDETVKTQVDSVIDWTKTRIVPDTGLSLFAASDFYTGNWLQYTSSSSTGLTLALLASYEDSSAALSYQGALTYRSATTPGAIDSGYGDDFGYGTRDIMEGLLSYSRMLSGSTNLYDVTDVPQIQMRYQNIAALGYNPVNNFSDLPANSDFSFSQVSSGTANYVLISNSLKGIAKDFVAYDFSLLVSGAAYHNNLNKPISLSLPIPAGYDNPTIYYLDDTGVYTKMTSTVTNGKITFVAPHFSTYVIVNEATASTPATPAITGDTTSLILFIMFAGLSLFGIVVTKKRIRMN